MQLSFIVPPDLVSLPAREVVGFAKDAGLDCVDVRINRLGEFAEACTQVGMSIGNVTGVAGAALSQDAAARAAGLEEAKAAVDAAAAQGVATIMPSTGTSTADSSANWHAFEETYPAFVSYAEQKGVAIAVENCPHGGKAIGYSPEWWRRMFELVRSDHFGLCFDPSHCYWLGIDHLRALDEFGGRVRYVHAKDAETIPDGCYEYGILGRQFETPELGPPGWFRSGWWRYRLPGLGHVDWEAFFKALHDVGYDGTVSLEHEDPLYEGSVSKAKEGLQLGARFLRRFIGS